MQLSLTVNGKAVNAEVEPRTLLVDFLRNQRHLTGVHIGCDTAQCGACTVLIDGKAMKSCNMLALQAAGCGVTTIEGLAHEDGTLHPMQAAFKTHHGLQCGFCTPGMVLMAKAYTLRGCGPDTAEAWLQANLCRCSGYQAIRRALDAAGLGATKAGDKP
jgi:carbon-monoxide dehydrogenase small subunit